MPVRALREVGWREGRVPHHGALAKAAGLEVSSGWSRQHGRSKRACAQEARSVVAQRTVQEVVVGGVAGLSRCPRRCRRRRRHCRRHRLLLGVGRRLSRSARVGGHPVAADAAETLKTGANTWAGERALIVAILLTRLVGTRLCRRVRA